MAHEQLYHDGSEQRSGAFDATVHISEEATNASVAIPFAIILGTTSSCLLGWGMINHSRAAILLSC